MIVLLEICLDVDGKETWLHREMELPFLPVVGMDFDFELLGQSDDMKHRRYATFVVEGMRWVDRASKLCIWLHEHEDEEYELTKDDFDPMTWKEGEKDLWLW